MKRGKNAPDNADKLVPYSIATEITGLPTGTLYSLVAQRRIPHVRLGPRLVRFRVSDLHKWLEDGEVPAAKGGSHE